MTENMGITRYLPTRLLQPFIKTYLIIEAQADLVNRVFPDTSLVMAFRFKGQTSYVANNTRTDLPLSVITGLRKSGRLINYSKGTGNILVIFREAGAAAFIKEPIYEMFEESVSLDNLAWYNNVSVIEDELSETENNTQRINLIEQFLLSKFNDPEPDVLVSGALERIHSAKGIIKIKSLADSLYISLDAFEKRFRKRVGVSPKQFSYIVRMKSIISTGITRQSLGDIVFEAGYSDQPHFNKDFKLFTGQTPTEYFKSPVLW